MTIIDDLEAINKDIAKAKNIKWQKARGEYWVVRLTNVYPDYHVYLSYNITSGNYEVQAFVRAGVL